MKIRNFIWLEEFEEKNIVKHHVYPAGIVEAFFNRPAFRHMEPGQRPGEDLYAVYSQTEAGRYLIVFFIRKVNGDALIISARDMTNKERKLYASRIR
jgi:uncharacterized DUF497 family protein